MAKATDEPGGDERGDAAGGRDLPVAIVVGVLLAGLFLGSLFWHPLAFTLVVAGLALTGLVETTRQLRRLGEPVAVPVLLLTTVVILGATYRLGTEGIVVGVLVLFGGGVAWELGAHDRRDVVRRLGNTAVLGLWVCVLASFAVLLATRDAEPEAALLSVVGGAVVGDIGGYAFGMAFGRHRIAPMVSPRKTWEGLIGGLALAGVLAWLVLPHVGELYTGPMSAAVVAVVAAFAGFVGDLVESMFKRDLGLKDMGAVLPGHGGILDRVDGILLALPVGYYALELLT